MDGYIVDQSFRRPGRHKKKVTQTFPGRSYNFPSHVLYNKLLVAGLCVFLNIQLLIADRIEKRRPTNLF
jgi:hypothetical protein